eukprot:XP_001702169.1 predicted protein [Chlamydomonas reinhardtii]
MAPASPLLPMQNLLPALMPRALSSSYLPPMLFVNPLWHMTVTPMKAVDYRHVSYNTVAVTEGFHMEHDPVGHGAPPPPPPPPPPPVPEASLLEAAVGAVAPLGDWAVETLIRQQRFDHDLDEDVKRAVAAVVVTRREVEGLVLPPRPPIRDAGEAVGQELDKAAAALRLVHNVFVGDAAAMQNLLPALMPRALSSSYLPPMLFVNPLWHMTVTPMKAVDYRHVSYNTVAVTELSPRAGLTLGGFMERAAEHFVDAAARKGGPAHWQGAPGLPPGMTYWGTRAAVSVLVAGQVVWDSGILSGGLKDMKSEDVQLTPVIRGGKVVGLVVQLEDRSISRLVNECANLNRGMMRTWTPLTGPQPVLSLINTSHLGNTAESAPQMAGMALGELLLSTVLNPAVVRNHPASIGPAWTEYTSLYARAKALRLPLLKGDDLTLNEAPLAVLGVELAGSVELLELLGLGDPEAADEPGCKFVVMLLNVLCWPLGLPLLGRSRHEQGSLAAVVVGLVDKLADGVELAYDEGYLRCRYVRRVDVAAALFMLVLEVWLEAVEKQTGLVASLRALLIVKQEQLGSWAAARQVVDARVREVQARAVGTAKSLVLLLLDLQHRLNKGEVVPLLPRIIGGMDVARAQQAASVAVAAQAAAVADAAAPAPQQQAGAWDVRARMPSPDMYPRLVGKRLLTQPQASSLDALWGLLSGPVASGATASSAAALPVSVSVKEETARLQHGLMRGASDPVLARRLCGLLQAAVEPDLWWQLDYKQQRQLMVFMRSNLPLAVAACNAWAEEGQRRTAELQQELVGTGPAQQQPQVPAGCELPASVVMPGYSEPPTAAAEAGSAAAPGASELQMGRFMQELQRQLAAPHIPPPPQEQAQLQPQPHFPPQPEEQEEEGGEQQRPRRRRLNEVP